MAAPPPWCFERFRFHRVHSESCTVCWRYQSSTLWKTLCLFRVLALLSGLRPL